MIDEMFRYIENLPVSEEFLQEMSKNKRLFNEVLNLSSDMHIMESLGDSESTYPLPDLEQKNTLIIEKIKKIDSNITDFLYKVRFVFDFKMIPIPVSRDNSSSELKSVYLYKNIEACIFENKVHLRFMHIKKHLEIKLNDKMIISISNRTYFDIELEDEGEYQIKIDGYKANIVIK